MSGLWSERWESIKSSSFFPFIFGKSFTLFKFLISYIYRYSKIEYWKNLNINRSKETLALALRNWADCLMDEPFVNMEEVPPMLALQTEQDAQLDICTLLRMAILFFIVSSTEPRIPHLRGCQTSGTSMVILCTHGTLLHYRIFT